MTLVGKPFWAGRPPEDGLIDEIKLRAKRYFAAAEQFGLLEKWREGEAVYFMRDREALTAGGTMATKLDLGTRKDPRVTIRIPEVRSLGRQQLAFLMAEKTAFRCVASMGETKSVLSAQLADPAVNYVYEDRVRPVMRQFAEKILRYGAGATHMRWDATKGDDVIEEVPITQNVPVQMQDGSVQLQPQTQIAKQPAKSGAPFVDALTPFEIAYDPVIGVKAGWVIAFERTNLYALAGEYPEQAEKILGQSCHDEFESYRLNTWQDAGGANEGDVVAMHFYYADRPELPRGRYCLVVGDMVVKDIPRCPLKAGRLPVRVLLTSPMDDCAFSFADLWGHHANEEALNRLRSSELTNFAYFGNQSRAMEEGTRPADLEKTSGNTTRTYIYPRGGKPPGAIPVLPMPDGSGVLKDELIKAMTRNSGFTDVSRGGTSEKTTSGAHLAGYEAITARNLSLTQGDLVKHEEEVANDLIEMLANYANTAFIAEIAGREGSPIAKEFAPSDLSSVRRVRAVAVPDAMRGPLARLALLEQTKDIEDPKERAKAMNMVLHGSDEWGKSDTRQIDRIASENERLVSGDAPVTAAASDDHVADLFEHRGVLDFLRTQDNPDPQAIMRITQHMMEHTQLVQQQDPVMAQLLGYPAPPILPGNPAFVFQQSILAAQQMLQPMAPPAPGGGDPNAPAPANDQQQQPAPQGAQQPEAAE